MHIPEIDFAIRVDARHDKDEARTASATEHESSDTKDNDAFVLFDHLETETHRERKGKRDDDPRDDDEHIAEHGADRFVVGWHVLH